VIQGQIDFDKSDDVTAGEALRQMTCEQCGTAFEPRAGSGGSRQRFCSQGCRYDFHNSKVQRVPPPPAYTLQTTLEAPEYPTEKDALRTSVEADDSFDWKRSEILLQPVPMTAAYIDPETGDLVIGQDGRSSYQDDSVVRIPADHIAAFIDRLTDVLGIPSAP
jgi:hypothetical protein